MSFIHESLTSLAVDIDTLIPLSGNPRVGDVSAIAASLQEFGQLKPVVVRSNGDGTSTVIAGNHTVEAARRLGWLEVAAVNVVDMDEKRAITFALADNRINELGSTNTSLLYEAIASVVDEYPEFLDNLGWDEFELASMNEQYDWAVQSEDRETGYIAPVLIPREEQAPIHAPTSTPASGVKKSEPSHIEAPNSINVNEAITRGASSVGQAGTKAVVQYTLVFDNADQQRQWYDFVRWLRSDPGTDGDTTAERLLNFLSAHANY